MKTKSLLTYEVVARWPQLAFSEVTAAIQEEGGLVALLRTRFGFTTKRAEREVASLMNDFTSRLHQAKAA